MLRCFDGQQKGPVMQTRTWVPLKDFARTIGRSLPTAKKIVVAAGIRRLALSIRWTLHPDDVMAYLEGRPLATAPKHNTSEQKRT